MRTLWIALMLVSAGLAGCLADGEPIEPVEPTATNGNASTDGGEDARTAEPNGTSGSSSDPGGSNGTSPSSNAGDGRQGNSTDASDDGGDDDADPRVETFNVTGSVELGYQAALGVEWTGVPSTVADAAGNDTVNGSGIDPGLTDAEHCPQATFSIASGSQHLAVEIHDEAVNVTNVPPGSTPSIPPNTTTPNASAPSLGAYSIQLTPPTGETVHLDWIAGQGPQASDQMNWSRANPSEGVWTIEAEPEGPVVDQTWRIDLTLAGESASPPSAIEPATTC